MCMDLPLDLELTKSITQLKRVEWKKDIMIHMTSQFDEGWQEVSWSGQGEWRDVKLIGGGDMLTRKYVSSKELNSLKRNSELVVLVASW
jgi:hypothetical protein